MKSSSPNDYGKLLVEDCEQYRINDYLQIYRDQVKKIIIKSKLNLDVHGILLTSTKTPYGGDRLWFVCPLCARRVGIIYKYPINTLIGCRLCLNLDYRSHRYKGMMEKELYLSKKL
jgi:hypothetical protein